MWNRSELKSNAKLALKANYWKAVLVGLILSFILGSGSTAAQNSARSSTDGLTDIDPVMVFTVIGIILAAVFVAMVISILLSIFIWNPIHGRNVQRYKNPLHRLLPSVRKSLVRSVHNAFVPADPQAHLLYVLHKF